MQIKKIFKSLLEIFYKVMSTIKLFYKYWNFGIGLRIETRPTWFFSKVQFPILDKVSEQLCIQTHDFFADPRVSDA